MITIGFPRMHKERMEKRDFAPTFFKQLKEEEAEFYLEYGYGSGMNFTHEDYINENSKIQFVNNNECYKKDIVVVLRSPEFNEIEIMREGSILVSMLHYPTREKRTEFLKEKNIFGISLDSIRNDLFERMVVNYSGTAGNGIKIAFEELSKAMKNFYSKGRNVINVSIVGMGMVGLMAAKAARVFGSPEINKNIKAAGAKGIVVRMLPKNITLDEKEMIRIIKNTDILVDASTRECTSEYIIKNDMLKYLNDYAIILDLTADPYLTDIEPIQVKGIEGIPTGSLDKIVFYPNDEEYDLIPGCVSKDNRRTVVSCNAWPGINPISCMDLYEKQMLPIMKTIIRDDVKRAKEESDDFFMRAIYRGTIDFYERFQVI